MGRYLKNYIQECNVLGLLRKGFILVYCGRNSNDIGFNPRYFESYQDFMYSEYFSNSYKVLNTVNGVNEITIFYFTGC